MLSKIRYLVEEALLGLRDLGAHIQTILVKFGAVFKDKYVWLTLVWLVALITAIML